MYPCDLHSDTLDCMPAACGHDYDRERDAKRAARLAAGPEVVETFAGPGGWDTGARLAGITATIKGYDYSKDACLTAEAAGHVRVLADVAAVSDSEIRAMRETCKGHISSPPCPGFSLAGKGKGRADLDLLRSALNYAVSGVPFVDVRNAVLAQQEDPRSVLSLEPIRWIMLLDPEWIALEQVPSVQPLWDVYADALRRLGYAVSTGVVDSEQYGVPQARRRAILMARKGTEAPVLVPTHSKYHRRSPERLDEGVAKWVSMAEALGWGTDEAVGFARRADNDDTVTIDGTDYRARDLAPTTRPSLVVTEKTRSWSRYFMGDVVRKNGAVRPVDAPAPTITGSMDNGNFRWIDRMVKPDEAIALGRGDWPEHRPSPTIVGSFAADVVAFPMYRGPGDGPRQNTPGGVRVTVQEAGALQSFPVDYPWQGSKTSQHQQAGDAVPPMLAAAILTAIGA